ncbi:MAG: ATP-dependent RNA helicase HrpA [Planctomycetes bacterium]|nr:ATP-dependent RNA helicase HrpA [Planctomycetota bacterium]
MSRRSSWRGRSRTRSPTSTRTGASTAAISRPSSSRGRAGAESGPGVARRCGRARTLPLPVSVDAQDLIKRIEGCFHADRTRLLAQLHRLTRGVRDARSDPAAIVRGLLQAEARVAARRARIPRPVFPPELPVSQRKDEIAKAIAQHQVIVVCGETGSGKTTQLPKICLELGRGVFGMIGHTQPRRIAARTVARRIADELGRPELVGYKVRFGDATGPDTVVKLMTDGILLAETQGDRALSRYDTIIVDEAHERSLNIDFLLGYLKTLLPRRKDLKVIVTSATIDPERFSRHFSDCPIISVSGRTYPVEVLYRSPLGGDEDERDSDFDRALVQAVDEAASYGDGDILAFFSGEREIREAAEVLHKHHVPGAPRATILPLFAKLSNDEQQRVFEPHDQHETRRIILATNVAETSLTVPGIRYVIDTGVARINRYSARTKVQRLEVEAISKASADQRKGRCGRVGPGVCIRLYSEEDFTTRPQYTDPEIVRTNLAAVILQMAALRLGRVEDFPFLDPPDSRLVKDGYDTLIELGAVTEAGELTPLGRDLAKLPIDPRIGRMILAANAENCLTEVLIIASALSIQDPRHRPFEKQDEADEAHAPFRDERSDFLSHLILWNAYRTQKRHLSSSKLRRWCKEHFLSFVRLKEWEEMHHQLADLAGGMGYHANQTKASPEAIHRALLPGLLSNIGFKGEQGEYLGARGLKFNIFPGSVMFKAGAKWVMACELVRTTKLYARTLAPIPPDAIERAATHLVKKTHYDPHWDGRVGRAMVFERVFLFGLELANKRRVHLGGVDPQEARKLFIHHALVEGDCEIEAPFLSHNTRLASRVRELETRARRQDLLMDAAARFAFYDRTVPKEVFAVAAFERWRQVACRGNDKFLFMSMQDLVAPGAEVPNAADFPDELDIGGMVVPLTYVFKVGAADDGITLRLPVEALGQLDVKRIEWLVPGMVGEKVETILRGLPKDFRRLLPTIGALAEKVTSELKFGAGDLREEIRSGVRRASAVDVPLETLRSVALPEHLLMRLEIVDQKGEVVYLGRDVNALRAKLTPQLRSTAMTNADARFKREGIKTWDFGDLPEKIEVERLGVKVAAFPALVDNRTSVGLRLFDSPGEAAISTRAGVRRLYVLDVAEDLRRQTSYVHNLERMAAQFAPLGSVQSLRGALSEAIADRAFLDGLPPVRSQREYFARRGVGLDRLGSAVREVCDLTAAILAGYHAVTLQLSGKIPAGWTPAIADIRDQLTHLFPPNFMVACPFERLRHYPRYLQGIVERLRKLPGEGLNRDIRHAAEMAPLWRAGLELVRRQHELGLDPVKVAEYRWQCEEMRVSLFAQELRTAVPVSAKRLQELWTSIVSR